MPWRPLSRIAFAVAIYPFQPSSPADLPLELGDELYIIEEGGLNGSWYRGYLVAPPSLLAGLTSVKGQTLEARVFSGIFPRSCVEVREVLGDTSSRDGSGMEGNYLNGQAEDANGDSNPTRQNGYHNGRRDSGSLQRTFSNASSVRASDLAIGRNASLRKRSDQLDDRAMARRSTLSSIGPREPGAPRPPAPVPMLKIGDETPTSASEPLVDEIASCLREWHSTNLHELLLSRRYTVLEQLSRLVQKVDLARRQLLHGVLTDQELVALREKTVWDLVRGNKMLGSEIIVRDPKQRGRLLTAEDPPVEVSKLQSVMSLLDNPPSPPPDQIGLHHLMVELKGLNTQDSEPPSVIFYLCTKPPEEPPKPLTEAFAVEVPGHEELNRAITGGKMRTLFTDLALKDIGESLGHAGQVYLVVKVQSNQLSQPTPASTPRNNSANGANSPSQTMAGGKTSTSSPMRKGRQSLMWAQGKLAGSYRSKDQFSSSVGKISEISGSVASLDLESRPQTSATQRPPTQQGPQYIKRDIGVAVLPLRHMVGQDRDFDQSLIVWAPVEDRSDIAELQEKWDDVVPHLLHSRSGHYKKLKNLDRVRVNIHPFVSPDAGSLIEKTPTLLHGITETPKIGFSGAPKKPRSGIYITVSKAQILSNAVFSHPERGNTPLGTSLDMRNIQLTLEVRKGNGERIERCIFPSSNSVGTTAWRTTAVVRDTAWNQTIKLTIPSEHVPDCHLIMSIAEAPGFPFALGWMPLWDQQAFIKDGTHSPILYHYDKSTREAYLNFPWTSKDTNRVDNSTSPLATLKIESYLCSTFLSQNQVLLRVLNWREQPEEHLLDLLRQLSFVPEIEIVKVVNKVFDALFSILVDHSGSDDYEDLIFHSLVTILGIVHDRRFNLGPLVKGYAETKFLYPFATPCLIRSCLRMLSNPADAENARKSRATFKVGRQMLKFIVEARKQQKEKEAGIGITSTQSAFNRDLRNIFAALEALMQDNSPVTIGSKTLLVQHMHSWLPELRECFTEIEIMDTISSFIDACAGVKGKLILHKLILILNIAQSIRSLSKDLQIQFDSRISGWIEPYWGSTDEVNEQWREQVRLCCSIVASQQIDFGRHTCEYFYKVVQSYQAIKAAPLVEKQSFSMLFPSSYPFPSKNPPSPKSFDENLIELAAILATMMNESDTHLLSKMAREHIAAILELNMSILNGDGFPSSWLTLHVFHHRTILKNLYSMYEVMLIKLLPSPEDADSFDTEIWRMFFTALLKLVRSEALALETLPEQKRRAVWKIAGDVREQGAELLRRSWNAIGWDTNMQEQRMYGLQRLGGYQVQYVPSLVGPIIELCMSVHEGLRSVAVEVLQSMIVSEWTLNEDLSVIQAETIECLDQLLKSRDLGERAQQKLFIGEVLDLFEPVSRSQDNMLYEALKGLIATVDELLDLLVAVHSQDVTEAYRIIQTLRLMDFFKDVNKEDIFIRYVHHLAKIQAQSRNSTEAGLALRLHADLYDWDPRMIVPPLVDPEYPEQTAFERKESLYFDMIRYFEEGAAWDCALASYHEVAEQYEGAVYDFAKLARAQRSMATIHEVIARGEDQTPRYFRVAYRGLGFPQTLRDKSFIFQGASSERLAAFIDRLQQQHPTAQVVPHGDIDNVEGQFLQISSVSPYRDLEHPIYQATKVSHPTRDFILSSQPFQFAITSRRHSPKSGVKDQWIEKTVYTTASPFPTILRRSEIVQEDVIALSPLQTAIERTTRKTSELVILEKRIIGGDESGFSALTEAIKASVDPNSLTSVAQYRELLPDLSHNDAEEQTEMAPEFRPLENALKIALLDHVTTLRHVFTLYSRPPSTSPPFELMSQFSSTFAPELAVLSPTPRQPTQAPQPSWLPPIDTSAVTLGRAPSMTSHKSPQTLKNGIHNHHQHQPSTDTQMTATSPSRVEAQSPQSSHNHMSLSFLKFNGVSSPETPPTTNGSRSHHHLHPPGDEDTRSMVSSSRATTHSQGKGNSDSRKARSKSNVSEKTNGAPASTKSMSHSQTSGTPSGKGRKSQAAEQPIRPTTAASSVRTTDTGATGKAAAAMKRLSSFALGKKESKSTFDSGRTGIREE
ncbi:MAG: hypothetical protein MMC33_000044 [Icmadophila ericetorum]|nr:hypothetical protein [Icmadophila ericetorum]